MVVLFTHNDLDGVGCGILAKCAFGDKAEVRYNSVGGLDAQVERFLERAKESDRKTDMLYITDLSVSEDNEKALDKYAAAGGKLKLIDHHKTSLSYNQYKWGRVLVAYEDGRLTSATSLFYEELAERGVLRRSAATDEFVELVRQYDTWEWEANDNILAKRLNDLFYLMSIEDFEASMMERLQHGKHFHFDEFEEKVLDMEEEKIERYIRRKKRGLVQACIDGRCVGIVHAESYHSELGNVLGKDYDHLDYIAILNMGGKKVSLRTIHDGIDVSEIAARYGGGGHAKAAGCNMTEELFRVFVAEAFHSEPIQADAFRNERNLKASEGGTLYENRKADTLFLEPSPAGWTVERNRMRLDETFPSFEAAERFVKREFAAWLARDEKYDKYAAEAQPV